MEKFLNLTKAYLGMNTWVGYKMRIAFVNPRYQYQFCTIPIGLLHVASYAQSLGHNVMIFDELVGKVDYTDVSGLDAIGISCMFQNQYARTIEIIRLLRGHKVFVGGMYASVSGENFEDAVVLRGEGEPALFEYLYNVKVQHQVYPEYVPELQYNLLSINKYFERKRDNLTVAKRHISMVTSRGCPHDCTFCSSASIWQRRYRALPAGRVLDEIDRLIVNYGVREISFEDDNISLVRERFLSICEGLAKRKIIWNTPNGIHVNTLDDNLLKIMKRSGCNRLHFGIESGDPGILAEMNKNIELEKVREVVGLCRKHRIRALGYFVIGMPSETDESLRRTIDFAKSINLDEIAVFIAYPYPGTRLKEIYREQPKAQEWQSLFLSEFYREQFKRHPVYYAGRVLRKPDLALRYVKEMLKLNTRKGLKT